MIHDRSDRQLQSYVCVQVSKFLYKFFEKRIVAQSDDVAHAIVRAVERRRREVVVPWFPYRLALVLYGLAPVLLGRLGERAVRRSRTFASKAAEGDGGAS